MPGKAEGNSNRILSAVSWRWGRFWMRYAGLSWHGRMATRLANWGARPYKHRVVLSSWNPHGYFSPTAQICHPKLETGAHVFVGDRVTIFGWADSGTVRLGDRVRLLSDIVIETGGGGGVVIEDDVYIHPQCQISAHQEHIIIGRRVMIAANCAMYVHNHGTAPDRPIRDQPLKTTGPMVIGDEVWIGTGVKIIGGVRIGYGAVVGAGAVVTKDIPDYGVAVGVPARVVRSRLDVDPKTAAARG